MRAKNINSTEISALFGINPYMSQFELWHKLKSQQVTEIEETERMKWGNWLQDAIALGVSELRPEWKLRKMTEYIYDADAGIGSSFDYEIQGVGILEIKNVDSLAYKTGWLETDNEVEAPPHIELQVQHQMLVSKRDKAYIAVLVGGNSVSILERQAHAGIQESIKNKAVEFWESIKKGIEPAPDFKRDLDIIKKLNEYAEPGKVIEGTKDMAALAAKYSMLSEQIKAQTAQRDAVKAELITLIGDAEKVKGEGFSISSGVIGESQISYTRKPYRDFRVFIKGTK